MPYLPVCKKCPGTYVHRPLYGETALFTNFYFARGSSAEVLWWARLSVCLSVYPPGYLRNHTRDLQQFFCACRSSSGRVTKSQGKGQFWGFSSALTMHRNAFAAKRIIQSPITLYNRRDHSVAAAFAANSTGREGDDGTHGSAQRGRSVIYDCLVSVFGCGRINAVDNHMP